MHASWELALSDRTVRLKVREEILSRFLHSWKKRTFDVQTGVVQTSQLGTNELLKRTKFVHLSIVGTLTTMSVRKVPTKCKAPIYISGLLFKTEMYFSLPQAHSSHGDILLQSRAYSGKKNIILFCNRWYVAKLRVIWRTGTSLYVILLKYFRGIYWYSLF